MGHNTPFIESLKDTNEKKRAVLKSYEDVVKPILMAGLHEGEDQQLSAPKLLENLHKAMT